MGSDNHEAKAALLIKGEYVATDHHSVFKMNDSLFLFFWLLLLLHANYM